MGGNNSGIKVGDRVRVERHGCGTVVGLESERAQVHFDGDHEDDSYGVPYSRIIRV